MGPYLAILGGLVSLFVGGNLLVRGAVAIARRLRLSPLLIGLTVVAFSTSAPELVVSLDAALRGAPDIALGNVVGTNISNLGLVLGVAALASPIAADWRDVSRDVWVMVGATIALMIAVLGGAIGRVEGTLFIFGLVAYVVLSYGAEIRARTAREDWRAEEVAELAEVRPGLYGAVLMVAGGILGLVVGGELLVDGAAEVARSLGVTDAVIGLTVVAIGTSTPELATCVVASLRGDDDVALGNAVGSNVFNILLILGVAPLVRPLTVSPQLLWSTALMLLGTVAFAILIWRRPTLERRDGAGLVAAYVAFLIAMYLVAG